MEVLCIAAALCFCVVLCVREIPGMLKKKQMKDFTVFTLLLAFGGTLAVLKCLKVEIPNPSDMIAWFFSPFSKIVETLLE
jgi:hypothetical protein